MPTRTARGNRQKVSRAGVHIALGSDTFSGRGLFGANTVEEAELMVAAGMTPTQVLAAGTSGASRQCARPDLGTVARGKCADLLVLDADPTADIGNLRRLRMVILNGELAVDKRRAVSSGSPR
ncbi:amidohydrolase family protein [Streptomyces rochei]|uniref:amidohydrolase family protein n=1 Tax=Streptomyces rochei TaxID=1928 RepID=UPI003802F19A